MNRLTIAETYDRVWPSPWVLPIFFTLVSLVAMAMGITIIVAVYKYFRKDMHIDIKLALILTITDVLSGIDFLVAAIFNYPPVNLYSKYTNLCIIAQVTGSVTFVASAIMVGVIALERCLLIVYNIELNDTYYWIMIAACFLFPVINSLLVIFTDSINLFTGGVFCHYDAQTFTGKVAYILMMIYMGTAVCVLCFSYTKIVLFRYNHSQREQLELGLDPEKVRKDTKRTAIKLMSILIINVATNIPYLVAQICGLIEYDLYSPKVAFFVIPWTGCVIIWNSFIFLGLHEEVFKKWKQVIGLKSE
ncbi:hypothetical protein CONCODRAFT_8559 [Conidiobolus coronatus NRRL 28638]|uniref:G-protein coupled receptors family 1 profile domain-containing protein n=1 Tax=Conidiobolus coronatus (strain ATCC 28846 / CBS 209.66 / NRRL 28638) TaxID=796925 RepID=A0A137P1Y7_CONC2|nr:hypothetical protein CONCODRAFT_8559 [Conidiobolus coronatus NRRL 28638]|eukprot:KXN69075.1 hypothetical protein CONCODRAFT_8559 [Conidiobolus coronatus NRRL 28638]